MQKARDAGSKVTQNIDLTSHSLHLASEIDQRWRIIPQRSTAWKLNLQDWKYGNRNTVIPHPTFRKLRKENLRNPKPTKRRSASRILQVVEGKSAETTFHIPHPAKFLIPQTVQMRISSRKLNFLAEFLDRSDHPSHYQTDQSTLRLSKMH